MAPVPTPVTEGGQATPLLGALPAGVEQRRGAGVLASALEARHWSRIRFSVDCAMVLVSMIAALLVRPGTYTGTHRLLLGLFACVALATLYTRRRRDELLLGSAIDTTFNALVAVSLAAMLMLAAASVLGVRRPGAFTLPLWLLASVYLAGARVLLLEMRRYAIGSEALSTPTLIVGAGTVGTQIAHRLLADRRYGLRPVGLLDADPLEPDQARREGNLPMLGHIVDLPAALAQTGARHVIFAFPADSDRTLVPQIRTCEELGLTVSVVPRLFEAINDRTSVDHVGGLPLLALRPTDPRSWQFAVKHAFDKIAAALGLVALLPVLLLIAASVRATSPGPVLFRQRRVGRDGHVFDLLKFRTMRQPVAAQAFEPPAGCAPGGIEGEDRRTVVGHFLRATSLDELPQLLNVLRGDMSLVGPRPERPEYVERFTRDVASYERRHRVKSGITGWAQVNGLRGQTSIADRAEWDNHYIENWSLLLDLRILAMTLVSVLQLDGDT